jgi:hypothetical protein
MSLILIVKIWRIELNGEHPNEIVVTNVLIALFFLLLFEFVRRTGEYFNTVIYHHRSCLQLQKVEFVAAVFHIGGCRT